MNIHAASGPALLFSLPGDVVSGSNYLSGLERSVISARLTSCSCAIVLKQIRSSSTLIASLQLLAHDISYAKVLLANFCVDGIIVSHLESQGDVPVERV